MRKISVIINTLNEEKNLPRCLASVKNLADEVVVVDMNSSDNTPVIARKAGAKVYTHRRMGYVEPERKYDISKATNKWILILDADEEIPKSLAVEIKKIIKSPKADYYRLPRKNIIFGKWIRYSRWWPDYNIRLFKKGTVIWSEIIHSIPETRGKGSDLEPSEKFAITHHNYQSIEQFLNRLNRYTSYQAESLINDGYKFVWSDVLTKPSKEFAGRFFASEGYKDNLHGLALALLQAFSELVLYLKVWQYEGFTQKKLEVKEVTAKIKDTQKDLNYWTADTLLKHSGGAVQRIKRRFKLP